MKVKTCFLRARTVELETPLPLIESGGARGGTDAWACAGGSTAGSLAIVHFGSVGRLCGLFERSKAT